MSYHPSGITIEIVGTEVSSNGRACGSHDVCGSVLCDDVVVRLRKVQNIWFLMALINVGLASSHGT